MAHRPQSERFILLPLLANRYPLCSITDVAPMIRILASLFHVGPDFGKPCSDVMCLYGRFARRRIADRHDRPPLQVGCVREAGLPPGFSHCRPSPSVKARPGVKSECVSDPRRTGDNKVFAHPITSSSGVSSRAAPAGPGQPPVAVLGVRPRVANQVSLC